MVRVRRGVELDAQQQAKLRSEVALRADIERFEEVESGNDEAVEDKVVPGHVAPPSPPLSMQSSLAVGQSVLQERRARKKQRHLEKLERRRAKEAKAD